jgi:hypothetical protein
VPRICIKLYPGIRLTTEENHGKTTVGVAERRLTEDCWARFVWSTWWPFHGRPRLACWPSSPLACTSGRLGSCNSNMPFAQFIYLWMAWIVGGREPIGVDGRSVKMAAISLVASWSLQLQCALPGPAKHEPTFSVEVIVVELYFYCERVRLRAQN